MRDAAANLCDGTHVVLSANIEQSDDMAQALASGAEGVGLFRTEFLYFNRDDLPGEEEQFVAYRSVVETAQSRPVIIRTLVDLVPGKAPVSADLETTAQIRNQR